MTILIVILLIIIILLLLHINSKLPGRDYIQEALKRDQERAKQKETSSE